MSLVGMQRRLTYWQILILSTGHGSFMSSFHSFGTVVVVCVCILKTENKRL